MHLLIRGNRSLGVEFERETEAKDMKSNHYTATSPCCFLLLPAFQQINNIERDDLKFISHRGGQYTGFASVTGVAPVG